MAKGARASTKKANNVRLKQRVFGPVETERTARLSAKLLELASQPKPKKTTEDVVSEMEDAPVKDEKPAPTSERIAQEDMEIDGETNANTSPRPSRKGRIEKRKGSRSRKASIVFPRYKNGKKTTGTRGKRS